MKVFLLVALLIAATAALKPRCPPKDGRRAVLLADSRSCSRFYICSNGVPIRQNCPAGLWFNNKLKVCDWPKRVKCGRRPRSLEEEFGGDIDDSEEEIFEGYQGSEEEEVQLQ